MGENVFDIYQAAITHTCRMNYSGNIRPQLGWSVNGRELNGTQGTEFGVVTSSVTLAAMSLFDGANVTCEAFIRDNSSEDIRTGDLWASDTIRVKCKYNLSDALYI